MILTSILVLTLKKATTWHGKLSTLTMNNKNSILAAVKKIKGAEVGIAEGSTEYDVIPTGIPEIDKKVFVVGGLPRGVLIELGGPSGAGKSALVMKFLALVQEQGGVAALFDCENAYDEHWGAKLGIDNRELIRPDFTSGEDAFKIMFRLIKAGVDFIAIDSIARLVSRVDLERIYEGKGKKPGAQAQLIRENFGVILNGFRPPQGKPLPRLRETNCCIVGINHLTASFNPYETYKTSGGDATTFDPHVRLSCWPRGFSREVDEAGYPLKQRLLLRVEKSRLGWVTRAEVALWLTNIGGMEVAEDENYLYELAKQRSYIDVNGAWLYFDWQGEQKINGRAKFLSFCSDNPEFKKHLLTNEEPPKKTPKNAAPLPKKRKTPFGS